MAPNAYDALLLRQEAGTLTWRGPALMLLARSLRAVGAQALTVAIFALRGSRTPWQDVAPWLSVYGTLIDAVIAHALMHGASVMIGALLPLLT
jgi:hypothetical protein